MAANGYRLLIGGERVDGDDGTYDIVNPATESVVGQAPEASTAQVVDAAAAAAAALPAWSRTSPEERAALIDRAADLFRARIDERSEEHTSELQSLMRSSYAVFCLKKKTTQAPTDHHRKVHNTKIHS